MSEYYGRIEKIRAEIAQILREKEEAQIEPEGPWRSIKIRLANLKLFTLTRQLRQEYSRGRVPTYD